MDLFSGGNQVFGIPFDPDNPQEAIKKISDVLSQQLGNVDKLTQATKHIEDKIKERLKGLKPGQKRFGASFDTESGDFAVKFGDDLKDPYIQCYLLLVTQLIHGALLLKHLREHGASDLEAHGTVCALKRLALTHAKQCTDE